MNHCLCFTSSFSVIIILHVSHNNPVWPWHILPELHLVSLLHWVSIYITAPVIAPWQFISYISSMLHPFYLPLLTNPFELIHWIPQYYKAVSSLLKPRYPKCSIPESHVFLREYLKQSLQFWSRKAKLRKNSSLVIVYSLPYDSIKTRIYISHKLLLSRLCVSNLLFGEHNNC